MGKEIENGGEIAGHRPAEESLVTHPSPRPVRDLIVALRKLPKASIIPVAGVALLLIVLTWSLVVVRLQDERRQAMDDEVTKNVNLARAHEERVRRVVQLLDQTLLTLRDDHSRLGSKMDISARLAALNIDRSFVGIVSLIGADGAVISTNSEGMHINFSDREYFKDHARDTTDRLIIGKPIKGRVTNAWIVSLTRPIYLADGRFGGVVFMAVDPTYLAQDYRDVLLGPRSAIAILGTDGITRVRRNLGKISYGEDVSAAKLYSMLPQNPQGNYEALAASDGILRSVSYRAVEGTTLIVVVASSVDDVLEPIKGRQIVYAVSASAITLLVIMAALMLMLLRIRQWQSQETLRKVNAELEVRVADRTSALTVANRELEVFAYSVAHDLRAPTRHVLAYCHELAQELRGSGSDVARSTLDSILRSANRQAALVDGLLDYARVGQVQPNPQQVDLGQLVASLLTQAQSERSDPENVRWTIDPLPSVYADPLLLDQVFANLLGNAVKFSAQKTCSEVAIKVLTADEREVQIEITDNGAGFDPRFAHKLFTIFERLHDRKEFAGTGIGLAIVRRVVDIIGGSISAMGRPGEGAVFRLTLLRSANPKVNSR